MNLVDLLDRPIASLDNEKHPPPTESDVTANEACAAIPPATISLEGAMGFAFPIAARAW